MIVFHETMDAYSLDVVRDPNPDNHHDFSRIVARIQWHAGHSPRMVVVHDHAVFTLDEMIETTAKLKEEVSRG